MKPSWCCTLDAVGFRDGTSNKIQLGFYRWAGELHVRKAFRNADRRDAQVCGDVPLEVLVGSSGVAAGHRPVAGHLHTEWRCSAGCAPVGPDLLQVTPIASGSEIHGAKHLLEPLLGALH